MTTVRKPCPVCNRGSKDTALAVTTDERGVVSYCHRCGYVEAENRQPRRLESIRASSVVQPLDWSTQAAGIWHRTQALRGTLGETYLRHRGCGLPPSDSHLRFLPGDGHHAPSLCAAVTDIVTGKPISLHFTRLAADGKGKAGTGYDKILLKGHRKRGGVIRLWPDDCVVYGLAIAEGIETALAASHAFTPIWAAVDAGNLAAFPVMPSIETLTLFADHDEAGLRAARECARRWQDAGREVRIMTPRTVGHDAADVVAA